jgi:hypothetical protein
MRTSALSLAFSSRSSCSSVVAALVVPEEVRTPQLGQYDDFLTSSRMARLQLVQLGLEQRVLLSLLNCLRMQV